MSIKTALLETTNQLKNLKESLNDIEQYSRCDCLEIRGIPKMDPNEQTNEIVMQLEEKIGVVLPLTELGCRTFMDRAAIAWNSLLCRLCQTV